jgi:hypothetical protein
MTKPETTPLTDEQKVIVEDFQKEVQKKVIEPLAEKEKDALYNRPPRTTLSDGTQIYPEHRTIDPKTGMQAGYVVLAEEERAKGFVRPVRWSYLHLKCNRVTTMNQTLSETYARDPYFYSGTFCSYCRVHGPIGEDGDFVWNNSDEKVGT